MLINLYNIGLFKVLEKYWLTPHEVAVRGCSFVREGTEAQKDGVDCGRARIIH